MKHELLDTETLASSMADIGSLASPTLGTDGGRADRASKVLQIDRLISFVILVCGLWTVTVGTRQIITSHSLVPLWDEWEEIDAIASAPHHSPPFRWLWALHNEHRIVFHRLLLLADIHLFGGNHWVYFWCMVVTQSLFLASVAWILHFAGVSGALWRAIVGLAAFALFCPSQWENFGWAFQTTFLLPGFLAMLALSALLKYERSVQQTSPRRTYLALSIVIAILATYSNANGVVVWPMLLLVAVALIPRREVIWAYVGFGLASIGSYLYRYAGASYHSTGDSIPHPSSPLASIGHPLLVLEYAAGYLGVIFPAWVRIRELLAIISGAFGLIVALAVAAYFLRRQRREPLSMALLGLTFFTASTALITALGRLDFGLTQAFSSRYQTVNLLFWFSVVSLVLLAVDKISPSWRTLVLAVVAVVMVLAFSVFPLGVKASRTRTQQAEAAATALLAGVPDKQALSVLFLDSSLVWRDADYLRRQHLFMFSDPKNDQMGRLLSTVYRIGPPERCRGQISMVERVSSEELLTDEETPAFRISGWAVDWVSKEPIQRLIIAADTRIVGYAASIAGPFTAKHSDLVRMPASTEWLGFARPLREAPVMDVYAVYDRGEALCRLATIEAPQR